MRRVLPFLALLLICATSLGAQEMEDVVYLKDGTVVRGVIIETVPNQSIRIRTSDGSVYVYTFNLIDRMTKEPVQAAQAAAQPAAAGPPQEETQLKHARKGFWIGLGLGYGSLGLSYENLDFDREGGFSGMLKLGGTLSQNLLIGIQSNGWTKTENDATLTFGVLAAVAQFYTGSNSGLYFVGGAGLGTFTGSYSGESETKTGFGWVVGTGYDLRLGSNFSLTPYFNFLGSSFDIFGTGDKVGVNLFQLGLAANFH